MIRFLVLILFALSISVNAQTFGPQQIIDMEPSSVRMVRSADIDGDGDLDIAIAAFDHIAWYKNLDGQGTFGPPIAIQEGMGQSFNIAFARVDNNNTIDIVVSFFDEGKLAWYPNLGSTFGSMQLIGSAIGAAGVSMNDLDNDGDNDVVFGISNNNGLYWFKNEDGNGNFGSPIPIDINIQNARTQAVGDIDGDGDLDVLTNSSGSVSVSWYENIDGQGTFGSQTPIESDGFYENFLYLYDIDVDGDLDILSEKGDLIIWRENLDGQGNYASFTIINDENINPSDASFNDIDKDGNNDILASFSTSNTITWQKNLDGTGTFGTQEIIDATLQRPRTLHLADLDNDGDLDLLSAALTVDNQELVWYENLTILATPDFEGLDIIVYPNPVIDILKIESLTPITKVVFYDMIGRKIQEDSKNFTEISLANIPSGLLFVEVITTNGKMIKKLLKR